KDIAFLPGRPVVQKPRGYGGWPEGDASYAGPNPPSGAVIAYYQKTRHTFGRMKLEILDASGRVVDTPPAGKRKGINRVVWSMQEKPPRVPTAAQTAGASNGPRVLPGTYTVRLTKGSKVVETPLLVSLDPRAPFTLEDRKAQYDAAMRAHALFGRMRDVVDRLNGYRGLAVERSRGLPEGGTLRKDLDAFAAKADAIRKDIVATSEGGAITGEERLREHLAHVYDALLSYEGRPGDYQLDRVTALERELKEVETRAAALAAKDLPALNEKLRARKLAPIADAAAP
ncbi:MAG: sialidase, partial [Thermoanaerobaculia bacterium]